MRLTSIPTPVLLFEAIAASRRWLGYALRSTLVLAMLVVMWVAWLSCRQGLEASPAAVPRFMAELGEQIYYGISGVQIALILLSAPSMTAGAVCIDRARGWLAHMFVTPLSDTEIVLGKLAVGLASSMSLLVAGLPVLALSLLLGGVIPEAIVILTIVSLAICLLGCTLAFALSVRASSTHEVLMVVFAAWGVWLLAAPLWASSARSGIISGPPAWFFKLNPFVLVYAPYVWPGYVAGSDVAIFVSACLAIAMAALGLSVLGLRGGLPVRGRRSDRLELLRREVRVRFFSWWPRPSLDGNPVLWREWHCNRPSRMGRIVTTLYIAGTTIAFAVGIADSVQHGVGRNGSGLHVGVNMFAIWSGLLLSSATTPTILTEERARGSLDILMSTPLSTHTIVLGKWWASYRRIMPLLILPALTGLFVAAAMPDFPMFLPRMLQRRFVPIRTSDRVFAGILPSAFLLAHGAAVTSLGLALATWLKRTGLAVAVSVGAFVVVSIGWIVAVVSVMRPLLNWWSNHVGRLEDATILTIEQATIALSPLGGQATPFDALLNAWNLDRGRVWRGLFLDLAFVSLVAAALLGLTLLTFNRCLGRMDESPRLRGFARSASRPRPAPFRSVPAGERA